MKTKFFPVSQGVTFVTIGSKKDRCTIGYRCINRMVQVAVSYCAPGDKWNAKTGQNIVLARLKEAWACGNAEGVISLPMGKESNSTIVATLSNMFFGFPTDVDTTS